jgi:A/G-specific adenine glycosylase
LYHSVNIREFILINLNNHPNFFASILLDWHRHSNRRVMPWKGEKDPYRIWLSEVILQQTRVEQGWAYYQHFVSSFPTIRHLAAAPDDEVFKLWEGLGYYSRCRNLIATARYIASERGGVFPDSFEEILALKGVGPYTAAAIASFAFELPHAVVDGNVIRVLARVFGMNMPSDDPSSRKIFNTLAQELLDPAYPAQYNQAIMDFGATVCMPQSPDCNSCPLHSDCQARQLGWVSRLPPRKQKPDKKKRFLHYIIFDHNGSLYLRKRQEKDIWQNLFEFYLHESDRLLEPAELVQQPFFKKIVNGGTFRLLNSSPPRRQLLTHQELTGRFFRVRLDHSPEGLEGFLAVKEQDLQKHAMPRFIVSYLNGKT